MNSSSKTPPRFVPTLTEVVPASIDSEAAALDAMEADLSAEPPSELAVPQNAPAPGLQPVLHSPRLADAVAGVRGISAIPRNLPPLPDSLPPQQSLSGGGVMPAHAELSESVNADTIAPQVNVGDLDSVSGGQAQEAAAEHAPARTLAGDSQREPLSSEVFSEAEGPAALSLAEPALENSVAAGANAPLAPDADWNGPHAQQLREQLAQRLMHRVDQMLEERLREAISAVVEDQARSMALQLRKEVETLVRASLQQAVAQELASQLQWPPGPASS